MDYDVAIIGAGPIGIFAAFQAGMLGMKTCVIDILDFAGGQCNTLYPEKPIYDIPGYPVILAEELINKLVLQAAPFKPQYLLSRQANSLLATDNGFIIGTSKHELIKTKSVMIAAGAGCFSPNRPPLVDIELYEGISVFYSVTTVDRFKGKKIVIAGGGDSAVDWAIALSASAQVSLVHRREKFRASPASVSKLQALVAESKINLVTNFQLSSLVGHDGKLSQVVLVDLEGNEKALDAEVLLPFFGLAQDLGPLLHFGLNIKNHHIAVKPPYFETAIPGIYAVGDVATYEGKLKLILTGFAEVAHVLHHAYSRVFDGKPLHFEYSTSKGIGS